MSTFSQHWRELAAIFDVHVVLTIGHGFDGGHGLLAVGHGVLAVGRGVLAVGHGPLAVGRGVGFG